MSAAPLEPADLSASMTDPENAEHVAFHRARSQNDRALPLEKSWSHLWLEENGFIAKPEPKTKGRRKTSSPALSQGNPPDILPIRGDGGKRVVESDLKNLAAELTFIASVIERPKLLTELVDQINPEEFAADAHRLLIAEVLARHRKGQPIDPVALGEALGRDPVFVESGGEQVLANALKPPPKNSDHKELLGIVRSNAMRRELFTVARDLQRAVVDGDLTDDQIVSQTRVRIESMKAPLSSGWELPLLNESGGASPFPLEVFPAPLKEFCAVAGRISYFPPDFLAVPCLPIAGAALGRTVRFKLKSEWYEYPSIFSFIVGTPGSGKSNGISRLAAKPVQRLGMELNDEYGWKLEAWEQTCQAAALERKPPPGVAPQPQRIDVDDITREKLVPILAKNPRGVVAIHDEMIDWIMGMNQYKRSGGNDKSIYPKIWSGIQVKVDRVSHAEGKEIVASNPFLCIAGGLQPDFLPFLSNGGIDDGFLDRWLVAYPDEIERGFSLDGVDEKYTDGWCNAFQRLWDRRPTFSHRDKPFDVQFTAKALQKFADWAIEECRIIVTDEEEKKFEGPWTKYRSYVIRLALILDQLHWAYNEKSPDRLRPVGVEALSGALELIHYFKNHYRRVHRKIHGRRGPDNKFAVRILHWLVKRQGQPTEVRQSTIYDNFRRHLESEPDALGPALAWLVERRCIRLIPQPARSRGRTPGPVYEINPHLYSQLRAPNAFNSQPAEAH